MRRVFTSSLLVVASLLLLAIGCRSGGDTSRPETQREFGVKMAKMNLWREAMFRFRREVEIAPDNAMAHNNLAVALEAVGDFDGAAKEYREALRLDRSNQYIQKNYSRFVEFTQKAKKRDAATAKATAALQAPATATDTAAATAPPAPAAAAAPPPAPQPPAPQPLAPQPPTPQPPTPQPPTPQPPTPPTTTNPPGGTL